MFCLFDRQLHWSPLIGFVITQRVSSVDCEFVHTSVLDGTVCLRT